MLALPAPPHRTLVCAPPRTGRPARWRLAIALVAWLLARPAMAEAQREFTRQAISVNVFGGPDVRMGRSVANGLRAWLERHHSKRDVSLLGSGDVEVLLDGSGIDHNRPLVGGSLSAVAQWLRADEIVDGSVESTPAAARLTGRLVLVRDERLVQPLGPVSAPRSRGRWRRCSGSWPKGDGGCPRTAGARTHCARGRRCVPQRSLAKGSSRRGAASLPAPAW